jgi:uncharacterized protein (DUF488 family)
MEARDTARRHEDESTVEPRQLFTIGYEGRSLDDLIDQLKSSGVRRVVDVRELPLSRRRGFSKTPLASALEAAGIAYEHVRKLGNPKPLRDRYKSGDVEGGARAYRAHLHNGSYSALVELAESLDEATCLLCFEAEHDRCHRAVITGAIAERVPRLAIAHL